jgi:hypothetical protein
MGRPLKSISMFPSETRPSLPGENKFYLSAELFIYGSLRRKIHTVVVRIEIGTVFIWVPSEISYSNKQVC